MILSRRVIQSLAITAAFIAAWLAMLLVGTGPIDHAVLGALYAGDRPILADAARLVTVLGDGRWVTAVSILAALGLMREQRIATAIVLLVGTGIGRIITEVQKYEVNRLRPGENPHLVATYSMSFPSAHSANSMMVYLSLAMLLPKELRGMWIAGALAIALMVGISRMMLGVHWPSDVVGGWSYGALWTLMLVTIDHTLKRNSKTSPS
jgi:undecaprenyl-diphosphatase